ncbi:VaFE repeat-containing surface-anchored protein [Peptostreptococcus anaerobius]|uniref:VaFE repeat-containing surface-anchored protein n=1 Tax=Peptostreptococcus anaerobius TaxID=1261 RepID=UPI0012FD4FC8|nr:VaFE repeat-containing surface-anchored protein [Peptostreptococcus anaerobius]
MGDKKARSDKELALKPEEVKDKLEVVDTVTYENLQPGENYSLEGKLMDITDVNNPEQVGEPVVKIVTVNDTGKGTWEVKFPNVELKENHKYVVYEKATSNKLLKIGQDGKPVANVIEHKDNTDKAQTIIVSKSGTTNPGGSNNNGGSNNETTHNKDLVVRKVTLGNDNVSLVRVVGAKIVIYEGVGKFRKEVDKWTTEKDLDHTVRGLEVGKKYTFHEEAAPKGLKVVTDFEFVIDKDGKVTILSSLTSGNAEFKDGVLVVTDDKDTGSGRQSGETGQGQPGGTGRGQSYKPSYESTGGSSHGTKTLTATGDGVNPSVYAGSMFALGVAMIILGRKRKIHVKSK